MRPKKSFIALLASAIIPFRLYAVEPAKEPTLAEKLSAWLKDKEQLAADLSAANQRATTAESALTTAKSEASAAATSAAALLTAANEKAATAEGKVTAAELQASGLNSQVTAYAALFATIGFKPTELKDKDGKALVVGTPEFTAAFQAAHNAHIADGVTQKMAELGIKADKLPAAAEGNGAETEADLVALLATAKTPAEKGAIGAKLNALRKAGWAAASGKN